MKQLLRKTLVAAIMLLVGAGHVVFGGTYASSLMASNADSTKPFDGSFTDGTGARLWFALNGRVDTARVWVVKNGNPVRTLDTLLNVAAGMYNVVWDGKDNGGNFVSPGQYSFRVFTSDTGNSSAQWAQAWENPVYLLTGGGLSSRDIEVIQDPTHPMFGNLILTESTTSYGYARMIVAHGNGTMSGEYARLLFPQGTSDFDPWFISIAQNGNQYVTNSSLAKVFVFKDSALAGTIQDAKIGSPKGIAAMGAGEPTLLIATGRAVVRRNPAGVVDTIFADTNAAGYTRDIAIDDSGYVFISFGASSTTYTKVLKLSRTFVPLDTLTLPDYVTHLNIFRGADRTTNTDDKIYCRVRGANGGVFSLDFTAKTSTKLFTPSTSTSGSHSIGVDALGNIYYANPSAEWVRMYIPPSSAPTKWTTNGGPMAVLGASTKLIDGFEAGVGHFSSQPTFSGSTVGIDATSSHKQSTTEGHSGTGSMEVTLIDNAAAATNWEVRFLSGVGVPASNDSINPQGWIGFWLKTRNARPGSMVAIGIDDPTDPVTKRSIKLPVINDGSWHVYQWNMSDSTQWTPWVVTSGSPKLKGPRLNIDAVWFFAPNGPEPWKINFDDVTYNAAGPIGFDAGTGDVTGNGTVSTLDAAWILQNVTALRPFSPQQVLAADVNLSHNGAAVNSFDASVVLASIVAKIPYLPWTMPPPPLANVNADEPAPLSLMIASADGNAGKIVTIPITVPQNLAGLRSAEMTVAFNPSLLKVRSVATTDLTKDFTIASNIQDGTVSIAMANGEALTHGGQILTIEAEVLQSSDAIGLTVDKILLNEQTISKVTSVGGGLVDVPTSYELLQNYPNPFNPATTINYRLPVSGYVELKVYDISGREVITLISEVQTAGEHKITWNATNDYGVKVSSGVYLYRLTAGSFTQIKKMVLLK
ncbi:MAG: T9SS type A sorting domain-containing protein [Ignavibacteriales bacterium]|nr:T9SS type A sorting domain-containing protein [Ignavibacteriales bacterium]